MAFGLGSGLITARSHRHPGLPKTLLQLIVSSLSVESTFLRSSPPTVDAARRRDAPPDAPLTRCRRRAAADALPPTPLSPTRRRRLLRHHGGRAAAAVPDGRARLQRERAADRDPLHQRFERRRGGEPRLRRALALRRLRRGLRRRRRHGRAAAALLRAGRLAVGAGAALRVPHCFGARRGDAPRQGDRRHAAGRVLGLAVRRLRRALAAWLRHRLAEAAAWPAGQHEVRTGAEGRLRVVLALALPLLSLPWRSARGTSCERARIAAVARRLVGRAL